MTQERTKRTILVVDDDVGILKVIEETLLPMGHQIILAGNGKDALAEINKKQISKIDLLLTDVMMPHMNGVELVDTLLSRDPALKVIYMSGYLRPSLNGHPSPDHEKGFLQKPFSGKTLNGYIKRALTS
ncbi:MAG: response regulator [Proteobacteria bacterium]|nr:response regulator [Pseudomonadota bacterium]MBU1688046.1 response regulator [Pseudomonadota bacterium]